MNIPDLGDGHWSILLTRAAGFLLGSVVPRLPFGEDALFR
jgi:hypothetical protein